MSATTLPVLEREFKSYTAYVDHLLADHLEPPIRSQVVAIVAGLEDALKRQARDEIDIEIRLTALEESVTRRLDELARLLSER